MTKAQDAKHGETSLQCRQRQRSQELNDKSNLNELMKECHNKLTSREIASHTMSKYKYPLSILGETKLVPQIFLLTWGLFENVFELTNGGIIGGNYVVNDLPLKQSQTSTFENDYRGQVNVEQCAEMMTRIEPSYAPNSSGQHYPLAGPETNYGNIGQAYGAMSQTQDYTMMEELTNSLYQTEGLLAMAQAMNEFMQNFVNGLRFDNESLKSHYSISCEKSVLRRDLDWVMKKAILRMLSRVFRSEQFDRELVKVQKVFVKHGHELGCQEARDLLMANQRLLGYDTNLPRKVKDVVIGLKKVKWECMETIASSSDLSPNLIHSMLERGDSGTGEGSSSRLTA
nr:hypothetical protein [Tanacetum cinerariifolium]